MLLIRNRDEFFRRIEKKLKGRRKNFYFRWHVSGDIIDADYFKRMVVQMQSNWPKIRREVMLEWAETAQDCPFDQETLDRIKLFTKEPIDFEDYCQTFSVQQGAIYMDKNEDLPDVTAEEKRLEYLTKKLFKEEVPKGYESLEMVEKEMGELDAKVREGHQYEFVGKVGQFVPVVNGIGGGKLYRIQDGRRFAIGGTSGYRWLEADTVKLYGWQDKVDLGYFREACDEAIADINKVSEPADFGYLVSE